MRVKSFVVRWLAGSLIVTLFSSAFAGPIELISGSNVEPSSSTPSGSSVGGILNSSNTVVVFSSEASDITTNLPPRTAQSAPLNGIFAFDPASALTTSVIPAYPAPTNAAGFSMASAVSADGRLVLFESSAANWVENDTNKATDIFVHDLSLNSTRLVSANQQGAPGNQNSDSPQFLLGETQVLFRSFAQNLKPAPPNVVNDYFIKNLATGQIDWRSWDSLTNVLRGKTFRFYTINDDLRIESQGRWLIWSSQYTLEGSSATIPLVLLYDSLTGGSSNVTLNFDPALGLPSPPAVSQPAVAPGGTRVSFLAQTSLICRDLSTGQDLLLTKDGSPRNPRFSSGGNRILFQQTISNVTQVVLRDIADVSNGVVSANSDGIMANSAAFSPKFFGTNDDQILFLSASTNLVPGTETRVERLYRKRLSAGTIEVLGPQNLTAGIDSFEISVDEKTILFETRSAGIVPRDLNNDSDLFLLNIETGLVQLVSKRDSTARPTTSAKSSSLEISSVSVAESRVVFASAANDWIINDLNNAEDVFVHDLSTRETRLVSRTETGASGNGRSFSPLISGDGKVIVYRSEATDLVPETAGAVGNPELIILETGGERILINTNYLTSPLTRGKEPLMSADGTRVLFISGLNELWSYSVPNRTLEQLMIPDFTSYLALSEDGRWLQLPVNTASTVVDLNDLSKPCRTLVQMFWGTNGISYVNTSSQLVLSNLQFGTTRLISVFGTVSSLAVSGDIAAFFVGSQLHISHLDTEKEVVAPYELPSLKAPRRIQILTAELIAIHTADALLPGDKNGFPEIYIYHIPSAILTRLDETDFPFLRWSNKIFAYCAAEDSLIVDSSDGWWIPGDFNAGADLYRISLTQMLDSDSDGILDAWERKYLGSSAPAASDDSDGDGLTNAQEFRFGTNPAEADPRPQLFIERIPFTPTRLRVGFEPENPKLPLVLERSSDLRLGWEAVPDGETYFEISGETVFYRVRVR
jgi:hypothetical protein